MDPSEIDALLLAHIQRPNYKPVKPRVIVKQLKLDEAGRRELKKSIKRQVKRGRLTYGTNHLVKLAAAASETNLVTGTFRRTRHGYGFVRPKLETRVASRDDDIYIPEKRSQDAANGDLVLVKVGKRKERGEQKWRGEIEEIIEREKRQFVGTYFEAEGTGMVQVDANIFVKAILVGDAGAKAAATDDKVVIEMVRFPSHVHDGEGVVTEVLGSRGEPGVDTLSIIREYNLPDEFPEDVLENARDQAEEFDESIGDDRVDMTGETVITIDPHDARDFDDAISLEEIDNGHWRLGVHIADVSHFVRPGTPLDRQARERATSVYLPDRVIPMLPEVISNNLASLQPNRVRYTQTALIEFTPDGAPVATDLHVSAIKSCRRFTYEEIDDYLGHPRRWKAKLKPRVFHLLGRMYKLAMILRRRRFERGALELSLPETKIDLNKQGKVSGAHLVENSESHQIIEEFMLAANEAVARRFRDEKWLFMRRIHEPPEPRKLKALNDFVKELGIQATSLDNRFELQRVLRHVQDLPQEHAVNFAALRSLPKAVYSPHDEGHFALASDCYCHFTSPIRRYPDLTIHRLIRALQNGRKPLQEMDRLMVEAEHCSDRERRAEQAERELVKLKLMNFLSQHIGKQLYAVITGVEDFGMFVMGVKLPAEGLIHISSLNDDHYRFDRRTHSLSGNQRGNDYRLGDRVVVQIARVDIDARQLDFRMVRRQKRADAEEVEQQTKSPFLPETTTAKRSAAKKRSTADGSKKKAKKKKAPRRKKSGRKPRG